MDFQDSNQPDPSQPLTLDRPWNDPSVDSPYPRPPQPQYARPQMPPSLYQSQMNQPPRPPDQYGQDFWARQAATNYPGVPQGPDMPSGLESYPAMARGNGYVAKWGSDNINQDAGRVSSLAMAFAPVLDLISRGAWSKEFNASSLNQLKLQQERLILEQEQVQVKHAEELTDYSSILARADALIKAAGTDSGKAQRAIEDAREELRFVAETKYGHRPLVAMLDQTAGLDGVKDFLNREDAAFRESWAGLTSLKKVTNADRDTETNREFGFGGGGGTGGITPGIFGPTPTPEDPEGRGPQAPQTSAVSDYDRDLLRKSGGTPEELAMARQMVGGQIPESYSERAKIPASQRTPTENRRLSEVNNLENQMNRDITGIANGPEVVNGKSKLDRIRDVSPELATTIDMLRNYDVDPNKEESIKNRPHILALTRSLFPSYKPGFYPVMEKYRDPNTPQGRALTRADRLASAWIQFNAAVSDLPGGESSKIPTNVMNMLGSEYWSGAPEYAQLNNAVRNLANEAIGALGTGQVPVSFVKQLLAHTPIYGSRAQLRAGAKVEMNNVWGVLQSANQRFKTESGLARDAPGINDFNMEVFDSVSRSNPFTGKLPTDAPEEVRITETRAKDKPSWLKKGQQDWAPMKKQDYNDAMNWLKNNPDDPLAAQLRIELGIMR